MAKISSLVTLGVFYSLLALAMCAKISIQGEKLTGEERAHTLALIELGTSDGKKYFLEDCTDEIACPYMNFAQAGEACKNSNLTLASIETSNQVAFLMRQLDRHMFAFVWTSAREEIIGASFVWDNDGRTPNGTAFNGEWDHRDFEGEPFPFHYCGVFDEYEGGIMATRLCSQTLAGALCQE